MEGFVAVPDAATANDDLAAIIEYDSESDGENRPSLAQLDWYAGLVPISSIHIPPAKQWMPGQSSADERARNETIAAAVARHGGWPSFLRSFPVIVTFVRDSDKLKLEDGWHRLTLARKAGEVSAYVLLGVRAAKTNPPYRIDPPLEDLRSGDVLTVYHGTDKAGVEAMLHGVDALQTVPRVHTASAGETLPGLFVTQDFETAKRFTKDLNYLIVELAVRAANLHGTDWDARIGGKVEDDFYRSKYPRSFRPSLSESLLGSEPQALLLGYVGPEKILAVWFGGERLSPKAAAKRLKLAYHGEDTVSPRRASAASVVRALGKSRFRGPEGEKHAKEKLLTLLSHSERAAERRRGGRLVGEAAPAEGGQLALPLSWETPREWTRAAMVGMLRSGELGFPVGKRAWLARHGAAKAESAARRRDKQSPAWVAWQLWGGDAAVRWLDGYLRTRPNPAPPLRPGFDALWIAEGHIEYAGLGGTPPGFTEIAVSPGRKIADVENATEFDPNAIAALSTFADAYGSDWTVRFDGANRGNLGEFLSQAAPSRTLSALPAKLYHGTSSAAWEAIQALGMAPRRSKAAAFVGGGSESNPDYVYLSADDGFDVQAAATAAARRDRSRGVILEVDSAHLDMGLLRPDEDSGKKTWQESLRKIATVAYEGTVPGEAIRLYATRVDGEWVKVPRANPRARRNPRAGRVRTVRRPDARKR